MSLLIGKKLAKNYSQKCWRKKGSCKMIFIKAEEGKKSTAHLAKSERVGRGYCSFVDKRFQESKSKLEEKELIEAEDITKGKYGKREIVPDIIPIGHPVRPLMEEDVERMYYYPPAFSFERFEPSRVEEEKRRRFETQFALYRLVYEVPFLQEYEKVKQEKGKALQEEKREKRRRKRKEMKEEGKLSSLKQLKPELRKLADQLSQQKYEMGLNLFKKVEDPNWDRNELLSFQFALSEANFKGFTEEGETDWFEWEEGEEREEMDYNYSVDAFDYKERGGIHSFLPPLPQEVYNMRENQMQQSMRSVLYQHGLLKRGLKGGLLPEYMVEPWMEDPSNPLSPSSSSSSPHLHYGLDPQKPINIFRGKNDPMWKRSFPARTLQFRFFNAEGKEIDFHTLLSSQLAFLQNTRSKLEDSPLDSHQLSSSPLHEGQQRTQQPNVAEQLRQQPQQQQQEEEEEIVSSEEEIFSSEGEEEGKEGEEEGEEEGLKEEREEEEKEEEEFLDYFSVEKLQVERVELSGVHKEVEEEFNEWIETEDGKEALRLLKKDPVGNPIFLERHLPSHLPFAVANVTEENRKSFLSFKELVDKVMMLVTGENSEGVIEGDPYRREREEKKRREKEEREKEREKEGEGEMERRGIQFKTFDFIEPQAGTKKRRKWLKRKVVMKVWLPSLCLPIVVYQRLVALAGTRYDSDSQILKLPADVYPTQHQNTLFLFGLLHKLINEAYLAHPQYVSSLSPHNYTSSLSSSSPSPLAPSLSSPSPLLLLHQFKQSHKANFLNQLRITAKHRDAVIFRIRNLPHPSLYHINNQNTLSLLHFKHLLSSL